MQLLIDSTQETPASLRFAASVLAQLADLMVPANEAEQPSINGISAPIVLHAHEPAAPIDPAPVAGADPAQLNPADVFGRPFNVPTGTMTRTETATVGDVSHSVTTVTAVPLAPPPPTGAAITAAVVSTDRDAEGLPWDERVHSETRKQNTDGTWRYRRNLDPNVKAAVVAELKAKYGNQVPLAATATAPAGLSGTPVMAPAPPVAPPPPTATVAPPAPVAHSPPVSVPDGVSMGVPVAPQPPVLPTLGFRDFMSSVNKALAAGHMTQDQLTAACKGAQVDGITALASEPDKIKLVHQQIAHLIGAAA